MPDTAGEELYQSVEMTLAHKDETSAGEKAALHSWSKGEGLQKLSFDGSVEVGTDIPLTWVVRYRTKEEHGAKPLVILDEVRREQEGVTVNRRYINLGRKTTAEVVLPVNIETRGYEKALNDMEWVSIKPGTDEAKTAEFAITCAESVLDSHQARTKIPHNLLTAHQNLLRNCARELQES